MTAEEKGKITQGTIAGFMRKRTQLVGFEFGYWKHSQYAAEFLDNALDAIESFQWKERAKGDSKIMFTLDKELSLENLSILQSEKEIEKGSSKPIDNEAKHSLAQAMGIEEPEAEDIQVDIPEINIEEIKPKDEVEVEVEVKDIIKRMEEIILPVESIVDDEPIVIIRLSEYEAASFLTSEISQKNVMGYTFEIFDNGTGMKKVDLKKYGKYLASSKSVELKQTRGSQGFGAPSAFSDSQNTTGKPIVTVSKSAKNIYATVAEFFTTSKNEKKYLVVPTEIDCPFLHGTYIKLNYLNVKYVRGYVDTYIKETALMNPHITLIFIDPYNEEFIYPRKVSSFPDQPKYAKPHPSSTNIGDLQDLLTKSENLTVSAFLQDNFVRVSSKTAKEVLSIAKRDLQDKLGILILKNGYVSKVQKKSDNAYYLRIEKRVYGRSKNARDKLIPYIIESPEISGNYWELISKYNQLISNTEKVGNEIKKHSNRIDKADTKKEQKTIEQDIRNELKKIDGFKKEKDKLKNDLDNLFKAVGEGFKEETNEKVINDLEDLVKVVEIVKAKPSELTSEQFNSLFLGFKSVKYMAPPTDTAIPVGDIILENTLIKELGLRVSENLDDFDTPQEGIKKSINILQELKKNELLREDSSLGDDFLNQISIDEQEIIEHNDQILASVNIKDESLTSEDFNKTIHELLTYSEDEPSEEYQDLYDFFLTTYSKDDDFVAGETRAPTSGKGLAYVVEAVMGFSYNPKILETPKRSRDVLSRFVNRTPKLRDSADCAITKAVQSVNWKNYKLELYDNNLPKGPLKLLVNVSGPFVHLMFKSQSKNSLADDEDLVKEIKACLEAIGRRLRVYINRKQLIKKSKNRSSLIEKYIPMFVKSVYNIASQGESVYKASLNQKELEDLMREAIGVKSAPVEAPLPSIQERSPKVEPGAEPSVEPDKPKDREEIKKEIVHEEVPTKVEVKKPEFDLDDISNWTVVKLRDYCNQNDIKIPQKITKNNIVTKIKESLSKERVEVKPEIEEEVPKKERVPLDKEISIKKAVPERKEFTEKTLGNWTIRELKEYCKENKLSTLSKDRKTDIINKILEFYKKPTEVQPEIDIAAKAPIIASPVAPGTIASKRAQLQAAKGTAPAAAKAPPEPKVAPPKPKTTQTKLPLITNERILQTLSKEWQPITGLIYKLKIKDMMDARFLQIKLKEMERKLLVLVDIQKGKKHWKLK